MIQFRLRLVTYEPVTGLVCLSESTKFIAHHVSGVTHTTIEMYQKRRGSENLRYVGDDPMLTNACGHLKTVTGLAC